MLSPFHHPRSLGLVRLLGVALALGSSAVLGHASLAGAAGPVVSLPNGTFGISPARRHVVGVPAAQLTPSTVSNTTQSRYRVSVFPVILSQQLSGAFDFSSSPLRLNEARMILGVGSDNFVLNPGQQRQVPLTWESLPAHVRAIAMGVLFQGVPLDRSGPVHVVSRLLSVNFLRLPGRYRIDGVFTRLQGEQLAPRALRFLARVKNTGGRFWAPADGRFLIRNASGRVVFSTAWPGDVVLSGAQRDFPIDVRRVLPAGHYVATALMRFGHRRSLSRPFTLVGPNQLPTPAVTFRDFNATGERGAPARVSGRILSTGTAPADFLVRLSLFAGQALTGVPLAQTTLAFRGLAPGTSRMFERALGGPLHAGSYSVIAQWVDPQGATHNAEAGFQATQPRNWLSSLWRFITGHAALLLALLALLLLALVVAALRRQQKRVKAELAAAHEKMHAAGLDVEASEPLQR